VDEGFEAGKLLELLRKEGFGPGQLRLKDRFLGKPLPEGKMSLTVSLTYLPGESTLTDEEVNRRHEALSAKLKASLPLEIRA
jgi:phenylalanyl-tRNA synthetase beta subunit